MADVRLTQHGTLNMLACLSREAYEHMIEHTAEDALWLGRSLAIEPRYTADIMAALVAEGFEVEEG